jgi:hypothetical protein
MWASLFGMNLKSGLEDDNLSFFAATGIAFAGVLLISMMGLRNLRKIQRVGLALHSEKASHWSWIPFGSWRRRHLERRIAQRREIQRRMEELYGIKPFEGPGAGGPGDPTGLGYYRADAVAFPGEATSLTQYTRPSTPSAPPTTAKDP